MSALKPYRCTECDRDYSTPSAAETCAEQDEVEDRETHRLLRSVN